MATLRELTVTDLRLAVAIAIGVATALTPFGSWLESTLVGHVLVEIPLLVAVGVVIGARAAPRLDSILGPINGGGIPGILLGTMTLVFWMIPRWLDASLTDVSVGAAKYSSLIVLVGMPLAWSWARLHPIARAVVKVELLAMLFRVGWLYLISPDRLCNNYLIDDQIQLGRGFLWIGFALSITWLIPAFFGSSIEAHDRIDKTMHQRDAML